MTTDKNLTRDELANDYDSCHSGSKALKEICANCGCTFGSHLASEYYSKTFDKSFPIDYCPGHEGEMDWDKGPGTVFKPSGKFKENEKTTEEKLMTKYLNPSEAVYGFAGRLTSRKEKTIMSASDDSAPIKVPLRYR